MTNWPNIQEYRHFEAKFFDSPKYNNLSNSAEGNDLESVIKNKNDPDDGQKVSESKIVRCVIQKDFEENFKKFDRGDGLAVNGNNNTECVRNKLHEPTTATLMEPSIADKIRLQNHLRWKKQKEMEFLQKKEAERIAQKKKKEEEMRAEQTKKLKEKEREEKIREWQEQKAREKEGKKREKMEMKVLEEELKEITPVIDKEKLIEEWVKLKDKQRQIEAEKKAEILKREEESKALRQNLAALSYRQWKERLKGRMMTLPKNGYQIFGPKPVPVVKEDWNHNFTSNSPRQPQGLNLRVTKSNITTNLPSLREFEDLPAFYLKNLGKKTPSSYNLKQVRSGMKVGGGDELQRNLQCQMPLKELQPGTLGFKKNNLKNNFKEDFKKSSLFSVEANPTAFLNSIAKNNEKDRSDKLNKFCNDLLPSLYSIISENEGNLSLSNSHLKKSDTLEETSNSVPQKKKIDLYINTSSQEEEEAAEENSPVKCPKKPSAISKNFTFKVHKENKKKETENKKIIGLPKKKPISRDKFVVQGSKKTSVSKAASEDKITTKNPSIREKAVKKLFTVQTNSKLMSRISRTSRSYDKPPKKILKEQHKTKGRFSSRSAKKIPGHREHVPKSKAFPKKRRNAKESKLSCSEGSTKNSKLAKDSEEKTRKKIKKKNPALPKSFSYTDSPYARKTTSTASEKTKKIHRKSGKNGETKSDGAGRCQKSLTIKT